VSDLCGDVEIMSVAHIDGDIICYAVASACEGKKYRYKGAVFESKLQLNKILIQDGVDDSAIEVFSEPATWEDTRKSVVSYTEDVIEKVGIDYKVYLTGKANFRYQVATIQPYKGNRASLQKPFHLDTIRQYLVDSYDAHVSVGMEADDSIGLAHNVETDIVVSLDKDLNCIPGDHYNWKEERLYTVSEHDADASFYCQVITGDSTDNIPGIYGMGAKSKVLTNVRESETEEEMFELAAKEYKCRFGNYWQQFMLENCELLWILQQRELPWKIRLKS